MKKVILGATGSIGSSLAKKLVDSGEQVHLVGRDENSLSELAKNLNSTFRVCDVLEENFSEKIPSSVLFGTLFIFLHISSNSFLLSPISIASSTLLSC